MPTLVKMPKWGLTMTAGTVTDWLRDEGTEVNAGEPLLTVETEKAVNDVDAPANGILRKIVAAAGSEVPVSGPVAIITAPDEDLSDDDLAVLLAAAQPKAATANRAAEPRQARAARAAARDDTGRVNASPAARKLARELGIDLAAVEATGPGGRITSDDVERVVAAMPRPEPEVRQEFVTLPDGRRLFAMSAGPADGMPIVFLHGLSGALSTWQMALPGFVEHYRILAFDLPGHGQSDRSSPETTDYSLSGLAEAIDGALTALAFPRATVVGHSLGGAVALRLALDYPARVARLILVDSAGLGDEINPEILDRIEAEPSEAEARALLSLFFHDQRLVLARGVAEMEQNQTAPGAAAAMRAIAAGAGFSREGQRTGLPERLGELELAVLIVWGEHDKVIPASHAAAGQAAIAGASVAILPAGHVPQLEATETFVQIVDRFVRHEPA